MKVFNFNEGTDTVIAKNKEEAISFLETITDYDSELSEEEVTDLDNFIVVDKVDHEKFLKMSEEEVKSNLIPISDYIKKYKVTEPEHFTSEL